MLRNTMIAAFAIAGLGLTVSGPALARGGFGGVHAGGFHAGGFHGAGFPGGAGFRGAAGGAGFRGVGPLGPRAAGPGYSPHPGWGAANWHHHSQWRRGFWPGVAIGVGFAAGWPYYAGYYDQPYYDPDGGYGGCYVARQRVMTRWGWRFRRVEICE